VAGEGSGQASYTPRLGSSVGRYRIESLLGRGGMGVVLLATDIELERPVALKLLAPELAHDAVFRERFLRESRMAAAIEHPGIVPVYEAGTAGDQLFIAMRYVPGEDLATLLDREAPLEAPRSLALATQLAEALDAAHARGLVHRDVKPANVLLEPGEPERALLADFGLTHRHGQTAAWSVGGPVGTLDYMAPELIERRPVDARADQYSLACLMFHCLAGSPPFEADSEAALLYAQVHAVRPRLSERRAGLGLGLDEVFIRGLARQPAERYPDCRALVVDAWRATAGLTGRSSRPVTVVDAGPADERLATTPPKPGKRGKPRQLFIIGSVMAVALAVPALGLLAANLAPPLAPPVTTPSATGDGAPAQTTAVPPIPPGMDETILFASNKGRGEEYDIYRIDPLPGSRPVALRNTGRDTNPSISPDGRWIAFTVGIRPDRDIWIMDAHGNDARPLTSDDADDWAPDWSPDGQSLLFNSSRAGSSDIYLMDGGVERFGEKRVRRLTDAPGFEEWPQFLPDGRVVFSTDMFGDNADLATLDPTQPRDRSAIDRLTAGVNFDLYATSASNGRIVFGRGVDFEDTDLFRMSPDGRRPQPIRVDPVSAEFPSVSPDGTRVVYSRGENLEAELFIVSITGGNPTRLTRDMKHAIQPDWGLLATGEPADATPLPSPTRATVVVSPH
jgi:serine/threonine-protein kinase